MGRMQSARSLAGAVLNRIDSETDRLSAQKLSAQTEQSAAEDLDMVQAISDFQTRQTGYDAALKSYSMVQRLSLFQYLGG
jgi:flagellar hook-associated protein 3 FlgL